jgi:hypothetical protein
VAAVDPSIETNADAFWTCSDPFTTLLRSNFLPHLLAWELECLRQDPDYVPCPGGDRDFEVFRLGQVVLSVRLLMPDGDAASSLLYGFCEHNLTANIGPGSVLIERWKQNWDGPAEVLDRTRRLIPCPSQVLEPGAHVRFEAHRDVARTGVGEGAAVVIALTRMQATRMRWVYDAFTLLPVHAEAADSTAARIEYAIALLAALDHTEAVPVIAALYDHPDHFVRWSAVCRVMDLDPSEGVHLVHRALQDPHPHVRRAARRSLDCIEGSREAARERTSHGTHA